QDMTEAVIRGYYGSAASKLERPTNISLETVKIAKKTRLFDKAHPAIKLYVAQVHAALIKSDYEFLCEFDQDWWGLKDRHSPEVAAESIINDYEENPY
ncbi:MAG TPA: hypothetical protein VE397_18180, partial [Stellaceae bacterium]|nr:hypothetical protein [Stellaceae bacterium]